MSIFRMQKIVCPSCGDSFRVFDNVAANTTLACPSCGGCLSARKRASGTDLVPADDHAPASRSVAGDQQQPPGLVRKQVAFRCARHSQKFSCWFMQRGASGSFVLDEIEKHDQPPTIASLFRRRDPTPAGSTGMDDIGSFDFTGWACPYCGCGRNGLDGAFFACACGELICGGRARRTLLGATIYRCHDGCGVEGRATGAIGQITARTGLLSGLSVSRARPRPSISRGKSTPLLPKK